MNMIISPSDFMYQGILYVKNTLSGRCYVLVEPTGKRSQAALKNLMVYKRISGSQYEKNLNACKQII